MTAGRFWMETPAVVRAAFDRACTAKDIVDMSVLVDICGAGVHVEVCWRTLRWTWHFLPIDGSDKALDAGDADRIVAALLAVIEHRAAQGEIAELEEARREAAGNLALVELDAIVAGGGAA